jgi:hypothetical protein
MSRELAANADSGTSTAQGKREVLSTGHRQVRTIARNEVSAGRLEFFPPNRGREGEHASTRRLPCPDSSGYVFHNEAILRVKTKPRRRCQIRLWVRLSILDVGEGHHVDGHRESGRL